MDNPLLDKIFDIGPGEGFCSFANADGKMWLMPVRNMRTAMGLYQPGGVRGRIVKRWLPHLSWSGAARRVIHAGKVSCTIRADLHKLIADILGVDDFEFSVFGGTPCVHQKITMQLSRGKRILAYCKLSDKAEIIDLFRREAETLSVLEQAGMCGQVPKTLYCGLLGDGTGIFVQSTIKTARSRAPHRWSSLQEDFLQRLRQATRRRLPFEQTDFFRALVELQNRLDWLPAPADRCQADNENSGGGLNLGDGLSHGSGLDHGDHGRAADKEDNGNRSLVNRCIETVLSKYAGRTVEFSACHSDFTPWNMFVERGRLFVFDWEYASLTCPPGLDRYHFFTQTAVFEKHRSAEEMISFLRSREAGWIDRELYTCYLLDVISRFTIRERGHVTGDVEKSFRIWLSMLDELNT